jgi:hypothetical protein
MSDFQSADDGGSSHTNTVKATLLQTFLARSGQRVITDDSGWETRENPCRT